MNEPRKIEWNGKNLTLREWSEETGINLCVLRNRYHRGVLPPKLFDDVKHECNSLCWYCRNAVPNEKYGCSWSRKFEPVAGWKAEATTTVCNDYSKLVKTKTIHSYHVCQCPEFVPD